MCDTELKYVQGPCVADVGGMGKLVVKLGNPLLGGSSYYLCCLENCGLGEDSSPLCVSLVSLDINDELSHALLQM